jgi:hypothetical protein
VAAFGRHGHLDAVGLLLVVGWVKPKPKERIIAAPKGDATPHGSKSLG